MGGVACSRASPVVQFVVGVHTPTAVPGSGAAENCVCVQYATQIRSVVLVGACAWNGALMVQFVTAVHTPSDVLAIGGGRANCPAPQCGTHRRDAVGVAATASYPSQYTTHGVPGATLVVGVLPAACGHAVTHTVSDV